MELILNELSLNLSALSKETACIWMANLVDVCRDAFRRGGKGRLRTKENFLHQIIAREYPVIRWLNNDVDRETRSLIRSLLTSSPYIDPETEIELNERALCSEFRFEEEIAKGFGVSYLLDALSVSFDIGERWDHSKISVQMEYLDENCKLLSENVEVRHASRLSHLFEHSLWFDSLRKRKIYEGHNGEDLWKYRNEFFPFLIFCNRIEDQLCKYHHGDPVFKQIVNKMFELNLYFSEWHSGLFNEDLLTFKVTPESQVTLTKYEEEHTFTCPSGEKILFSWHARITPGALRMFFVPDYKSRKGIIGHIGSKLSTMKYSA